MANTEERKPRRGIEFLEGIQRVLLQGAQERIEAAERDFAPPLNPHIAEIGARLEQADKDTLSARLSRIHPSLLKPARTPVSAAVSRNPLLALDILGERDSEGKSAVDYIISFYNDGEFASALMRYLGLINKADLIWCYDAVQKIRAEHNLRLSAISTSGEWDVCQL